MSAVAAESRAIGRLETAYLKQRRRQLYIACEDLDFVWSLSELRKFREMWNEGYSIVDIADELDRPQEEVAILILDQSNKGNIQPRKNGIF